MKSYRPAAAALLGLALISGTAAASEAPVTSKEPSAMLKSAIQIMRLEQRKAVRQNLRADFARMSAAIGEEMRARQLAGGPANATVKSEP